MAGFKVDALAAKDASGVLAPFKLTRREPTPKDVVIKILYCGICHSDLHTLKNEWGNTIYPTVPGHEITGVVAAIGSHVERFKIGDRVGVGCLVDACRECEACKEHLENYCAKPVLTYNTLLPDGSYTMGGYSTSIVVDQSFVVSIPQNLPLDAAAPLLCAGITVYSPMKYYGMVDEVGKTLGVVGLGGLGHMAVKFGKAFGLKVTVISTSPGKAKEAKELLKADDFLLSTDHEQMKAAAKSLNFIIDTVSAPHAIDPLLSLLKFNGKLVLVGAPEKPLAFNSFSVLSDRRLIGGSMIGGLEQTQEMMNFCGKYNITSIIEKIKLDSMNHAMERMKRSNVQYRFVVDVAAGFAN